MSIYGNILTGVLLAGGQNKRFPYLKGFIKVNGLTILEKNLGILKDLFQEVFLSANEPLPYLQFKAPIVKDLLPSTGPITGIYSCLKQSTSHSVFIMTCDMPFIEKDLVRHICEHYMKKLNANINYDAVIPKYNNTVEPLLGIYSKGSLLKMQRAIESEKVMMKRFLEEINTLYIDLSNIIDKNELWRLSFENINTLDDFDRYRDKGLELTI